LDLNVLPLEEILSGYGVVPALSRVGFPPARCTAIGCPRRDTVGAGAVGVGAHEQPGCQCFGGRREIALVLKQGLGTKPAIGPLPLKRGSVGTEDVKIRPTGPQCSAPGFAVFPWTAPVLNLLTLVDSCPAMGFEELLPLGRGRPFVQKISRSCPCG